MLLEVPRSDRRPIATKLILQDFQQGAPLG